jgi:hypothetical protein
MISPEERASRLFDKYTTLSDRERECALIAVDTVLKALDNYNFNLLNQQTYYWMDVKRELNNL